MARFRRLILCRTIQKKQLKSTQLMQKSKPFTIGIRTSKKAIPINRSLLSFCLFLKSQPAPFIRFITHL